MNIKYVFFCLILACAPIECKKISANILYGMTYAAIYGGASIGAWAFHLKYSSEVSKSSFKFFSRYSPEMVAQMSPLELSRSVASFFIPPILMLLPLHFFVETCLDKAVHNHIPGAANYMYSLGMRIPYI